MFDPQTLGLKGVSVRHELPAENRACDHIWTAHGLSRRRGYDEHIASGYCSRKLEFGESNLDRYGIIKPRLVLGFVALRHSQKTSFRKCLSKKHSRTRKP